MSKLQALRDGLARVGRFRSTIRLGSGASLTVSIVLWVLLVAFGLDVAADMGKLERAIMFLITAGFAVWSFRSFLLPALQTTETEEDLALLVEGKQGIHSDLIAALQFADGSRDQFGSDELRQAVIEQTHQMAGKIDYLRGFSRRELGQRAATLAVTLLVIGLICSAYPAHVGVFMKRFFLAGDHYPTDTMIANILSPGDKSPYGMPLVFDIEVKGVMPDKGRVEITADESGLRSTIDLEPVEGRPGIYSGVLERPMDHLTYQIFIGDAYTEPAHVKLIPLPVVNVDLEITMPDYVKGQFEAPVGRQKVAFEGSRVIPVVTSDKTLKSVSIRIEEKDYPLRKDGDRFVLDGDDSPLAAVTQTVRYDVQVVDVDDVSLAAPISGILQVRADRSPRVAGATPTRYVLPTAKPRIKYRAIDDYALAKVVAHVTVERAGVPPEDAEEGDLKQVADVTDHQSEVDGMFSVDLAPMDLKKGDRVAVVFEAFDYRGGLPGKSARSERIVFEVSDRAGVLAALGHLDADMNRKLDEIIRAQLGIGG
jgi:hypothetical protein